MFHPCQRGMTATSSVVAYAVGDGVGGFSSVVAVDFASVVAVGFSLVVGVASVVAMGFSLVVGSSRPLTHQLGLRHLFQKLNFVGRVHLAVGCSPDGTEINGSLR
jgi:hypothetical protein